MLKSQSFRPYSFPAFKPFVFLAMSSIPHRLQNLCGETFAIQPMIGEYFRRGTKLYGELIKRRYTRSLPLNTWFTRCFVGIRAILARLEARVDFRGIWKQESDVA